MCSFGLRPTCVPARCRHGTAWRAVGLPPPPAPRQAHSTAEPQPHPSRQVSHCGGTGLRFVIRRCRSRCYWRRSPGGRSCPWCCCPHACCDSRALRTNPACCDSAAAAAAAGALTGYQQTAPLRDGAVAHAAAKRLAGASPPACALPPLRQPLGCCHPAIWHRRRACLCVRTCALVCACDARLAAEQPLAAFGWRPAPAGSRPIPPPPVRGLVARAALRALPCCASPKPLPGARRRWTARPPLAAFATGATADGLLRCFATLKSHLECACLECTCCFSLLALPVVGSTSSPGCLHLFCPVSPCPVSTHPLGGYPSPIRKPPHPAAQHASLQVPQQAPAAEHPPAL